MVQIFYEIVKSHSEEIRLKSVAVDYSESIIQMLVN